LNGAVNVVVTAASPVVVGISRVSDVLGRVVVPSAGGVVAIVVAGAVAVSSVVAVVVPVVTDVTFWTVEQIDHSLMQKFR